MSSHLYKRNILKNDLKELIQDYIKDHDEMCADLQALIDKYRYRGLSVTHTKMLEDILKQEKEQYLKYCDTVLAEYKVN